MAMAKSKKEKKKVELKGWKNGEKG